jgi:DNA anti-recombination protein RmuC
VFKALNSVKTEINNLVRIGNEETVNQIQTSLGSLLEQFSNKMAELTEKFDSLHVDSSKDNIDGK